MTWLRKRADMIPEIIEDIEYLYRGVVPQNWDSENKRPSSATFKDSSGTSVDRDAGRNMDECIKFLSKKKNFKAICRITAKDVRSVNAEAIYKPTKENKYHSEIHDSVVKVQLSSGKARKVRDLSDTVWLSTIIQQNMG